jgi:hypothetical protein
MKETTDNPNRRKKMKKVLTIALTGVLAAAALAVESDPSNTVGFISQTLPAGYSTFSACPVGQAAGAAAGDFIGGQGLPGDVIYKWQGYWAPYNHTAAWTGLTFDFNAGYTYANNSGSAQTLVIAGDVIAEGTAINMATSTGGYFAWGNPLPMDLALDTDDLGLYAQIAANDKIYNWQGFWAPFTFDGTQTGLTIAAGESVLFSTAAGFTWDYTVGGAAVATAPARVQKTARSSQNLR